MRIVYFDMDSTRRDHLGVYGYGRATSPVIDTLARESIVFDHCYVSDAPCLPSRAALFSCRPGIANGVVSHEQPGCRFRPVGDEGMFRYWPEHDVPMRVLQQAGYHTATFSIFAPRHMAWWFNSGFATISLPDRPCYHENADTINPRAIKWLRAHVREHEDLFLHLNYMDPHTPYHPDDALIRRVASGPMRDWPTEEVIADHYANVYGPKSARDLHIRNVRNNYRSHDPRIPDAIACRADLKRMMNCYDASIAAVDRAIGEIIDVLKQEGVYDDTVLIVSADHGEAIGQMGMYFEHGVAVDGVCRVPLIVRWPGLTDAGGRCDALVYQHDFMATIADLLGLRRPAMWDGRSFAPALRGQPFEGRRYVVSGCGIFALQRMVRTKRHAYVRTLHSGCSPLDDTYLFDTDADPHQATNIRDDHPQLVAEMERLYSEWWHGWCSGPDAVVDPMMLQAPSFAYFPPEAMFRRLESLGRQDQIDDLRRRLARQPNAPTACRPE